jgi:hypothetical protein
MAALVRAVGNGGAKRKLKYLDPPAALVFSSSQHQQPTKQTTKSHYKTTIEAYFHTLPFVENHAAGYR